MLEHWIWLSMRAGLGPRRTQMLLHQFGTAEAVFRAPEAAFSHLPSDVVTSLSDHDLSAAKDVIRQCQTQKIRILTLEDPEYPNRLANIDDPPAVLYYKGTLPDFDAEAAIAMVGTRKASAYGLLQAKRLGIELAKSGMLVVSGGAAGVDTLCLNGALLSGAPAVAVLGCGVDVVYPAQNRALFRDLAALGCLISEYPPGSPPLREHFPARNRILSALSLGVLVVEAPARSGALITAQFALDQGQDVFTVPANIGAESCAGNLRLLKEGAILVETGMDVAQQYMAQYPHLKELSQEEVSFAQKSSQTTVSAERTDSFSAEAANSNRKTVDKEDSSVYIDLCGILDSLSSSEKSIVLALQSGPLHVDQLTDRTSLPAGQVLVGLTMLEVKGYITRLPAQRFSLAEK